jgi:hypothetical protein
LLAAYRIPPALAKILVDSNNNPQAFLTENNVSGLAR